MLISLILISENGDLNHNSNNPHNNPHGNPHGNPHNNTYNGPVTLYDLRHGTKKAPGVNEHSVRCILNVENWTAWRLKVSLSYWSDNEEVFVKLESNSATSRLCSNTNDILLIYFTQQDALVHNNCGYIMEKYGAVDVEPATREVMLGYKQVRKLKQNYT